MSFVALIFFNNLNAMSFMPDWVKPMVEEVAHEFNVDTPYIFQEMRGVRQFNCYVTPTCTDIRRSAFFGDLIIGDRLIEKLNYKELKVLTRRAFVSYKNWYRFKKASLIVAIIASNAYLFKLQKDAPLLALGILLLDAVAYLGLNVYCEKQIDKEVIKNAEEQEILDSAYQKISPNRWPLYHSFYKNVGRYIGF